MKDPNCGYCARGELLDAFGIVICELNVSTLILFKEQSHPGRCVVAYKDHVSEIVDLTDEERNAFMADVNRAAKAIHAAFQPARMATRAATCMCISCRNTGTASSGAACSR